MRSADDKRLTESQLLEMLGLESIQSLIRKRKLQWMAHCATRGDKDLTWKRMVREIEDEKSKWGSRLKEEWETLGVNSVRGWCNKVKDRGWLASKLGGSKMKRKEKKEDSRTEWNFINVTSKAAAKVCELDYFRARTTERRERG